LNNLVQVFNYENSSIRISIVENQPWWIAKDLCDILDLGDTGRAVKRLEEDEGTRIEIAHPQNPDKTINVLAVNESGLYSLILGSRKPEAKQFKRWITREVIPSIRKYGGYLTPEKTEEILLNPDTIIRLATDLKNEREARQALETKVEEDKPKVIFADSVVASKSSILVRELAKLLQQNGVKTGEKRLYEYMREKGYLIRKPGNDYNTPTQRAMQMGLFEVKKTVITHSDGKITVNTTPKVTGKGQMYFINKLRETS